MRGLLAVVACIALTVFNWGIYGPVLHKGQHAMNDSRWLPFIFVGLAYFAIAVIVPLAWLILAGEKGNWSTRGTVWSLAAGAAGAIGALGIILAFSFGGSPIYVMPLVFGCAPVVNTLYTMFMSRTFRDVGPVFFLGLIMVATGAVLVMVNKPSPPRKPVAAVEHSPADGATPAATTPAKPEPRMGLVVFMILATALAWGIYGPLLHQGQGLMSGSRLRPLMCVGLAYFLIAVIVPLLVLWKSPDQGELNLTGASWSLAAGAAGAIGALGIILAFNVGGKPIYVMPLVFGGAPVVNSFTEINMNHLWGHTTGMFYGALALTAAGAMTVLFFAPRPARHAAPAPAKAPETPAGQPA